MTWDDAKKACKVLGDGWRLPTIDELNTLYINKDKIGGFARDVYWSYTKNDDYNAWVQGFYGGVHYSTNKVFTSYVRAIRTF